ncbi:hypothetical protein MHYP_G00099140 [Metynnis hypsauchen]
MGFLPLSYGKILLVEPEQGNRIKPVIFVTKPDAGSARLLISHHGCLHKFLWKTRFISSAQLRMTSISQGPSSASSPNSSFSSSLFEFYHQSSNSALDGRFRRLCLCFNVA